MTREEATAIANGDKNRIIEILLELSAAIDCLTTEVADLRHRIARLTTDSSNSSKPPSSDGPQKKPIPRPRQKSKKRKPGGQPGHKGENRELVPVEEADRIEGVLPERCGCCGKPLGQDAQDSEILGNYLRYQVVELPLIKPIYLEFKLRAMKCSCGGITWAEIPRRLRSGFGQRFTAFLAYLTAVHRVTRRGCQELAKTLFDIDISLGSVCALHEEVSQALAPCCEDVKEDLPNQPVLNIDETGWKKHKLRRWLWILVTATAVYYTVQASRGAKVLKALLGEVYNGILCSDMLAVYGAFHKGLRQLCWAHIIRHIRGIKHACRGPDGVKFSKWMLSETGRMFGLWHAFKAGHMDRQTLVRKSVPVRARMYRCLENYRLSSDPDVARMARGLLKNWEHLFTFLEHEGVEPTNNSAERGARPAVQWRKICFGNQSDAGELLTSRMLTATRSCVMQKRNSFDFIVDAIEAHRTGLPHPSLLPVVPQASLGC
jgi:transposase